MPKGKIKQRREMQGMTHDWNVQYNYLQMNNDGQILLHIFRMSCNGRLKRTIGFCRRSRNNPDFFPL